MGTGRRRVRIMIGVLLLALIVTACDSAKPLDDAESDQPAKVGILLTNSLQYILSNPFKIEMETLGYIEGENIEYLSLEVEDPDTCAATIDALIASEVDLIFTPSANDAKTVLTHTSDIPVVFASGFDEIVVPLYEMQQDGALITGITMGDATTKRLEMLLSMQPAIKKVLAPYDPNNELSTLGFELITQIAPELEVEIVGQEIPDLASSLAAAEAIPADIDAIFMWIEAYSVAAWPHWTEVAIERGLLTSLPIADIELLNVSMGYGPRLEIAGQQSAHIVDRILQGRPANQLLIQPSDPSFAVNLVVTEQTGLELDYSVLQRADVIVRPESDAFSVAPELAESSSACNATLETAVGSNTICLEIGCEALVDTPLIGYVDKVPVEACAQEGVVGICTTERTVSYLYDGDPTILEGGCLLNQGEWVTLSPSDQASGATAELVDEAD